MPINMTVGMGMIIVFFLIVGIITIVIGRKEDDHERVEFGSKVLFIVAVLSALLTLITLIFKIIVVEV